MVADQGLRQLVAGHPAGAGMADHGAGALQHGEVAVGGALRQASELRPDVLLLDIDLAGESGLEVARRLAGQPGLAGSRMILISTHAEEDFAELIAASPAVGFLSKSDLSASAITRLLAHP